jgi:hypothetical protein
LADVIHVTVKRIITDFAEQTRQASAASMRH